MTDINPDELWARTLAYARRHLLTHKRLGYMAKAITDRPNHRYRPYQDLGTVAYLAGYDERQQMDSGPTLDRDAALIAFADDRLWHRCTADEKAAYREKATAARIMIGGTYAD